MTRPVVLLAEDDAGVRMTLQFVLADEGFDVLLAEDGEEALRLALERVPDMILLDHMMPKLTGRAVLDGVRSNAATASIPVLVLTGMGGGSAEDWADAEFVGKPFDPDELVELIRERLAER